MITFASRLSGQEGVPVVDLTLIDMVDSVAPTVRSRIMSKIRSKDTSAELAVRSFLHARGFRFRVHKKGFPGKPDIVLAKYRTVIFVHGCFWHQHHGCADFHIPRSNRRYWKNKLAGNVARDKAHQEKLTWLGWRVFIVWECKVDIESLELLAKEICAGITLGKTGGALALKLKDNELRSRR